MAKSSRSSGGEKGKKRPNVTPREEARMRGYLERGIFDNERDRISNFGNPLEKPLIVEFDPQDAAEGHFTLVSSGFTLGVSGTVSIATADAQINALQKKGIKYRTFELLK